MSDYLGRKYAVFNPHKKPVEDLPTIYGFNNGGETGWLQAALLAEDGTGFGGHICSTEAYMYFDLGILPGTAPARHEIFRAHYPDGYRMAFVPASEVQTHVGLNAAYERNQARRKEVSNG